MSERNRYTAQEMREMAGREKFKCSFVTRTLNGGIILDCTKDVLAMLRQAADAEDELAKLKARIEAVVKECERINDATFERSINKVVAYKTKVDVASDAICHRILRAARGEASGESEVK